MSVNDDGSTNVGVWQDGSTCLCGHEMLNHLKTKDEKDGDHYCLGYKKADGTKCVCRKYRPSFVSNPLPNKNYNLSHNQYGIPHYGRVLYK